jgi:hypothetical protein
MIDVSRIVQLHDEAVVRWHHQPIDNPYEGIEFLVCAEHGWNFQLWHEEDIARSPEVGDSGVARAKRNIDRWNQCRNDAIEQIDDWIAHQLEQQAVVPLPGARWNTETPGNAIDRLSVLSLRLYHLQEQLTRSDISDELRQSITMKISVCHEQRRRLCLALQELLAEIAAGRCYHAPFRQFKMYNDPQLNPYLHGSSLQKAR